MSYTAIGMGASRNPDGSITVKAQIRRDSDGSQVEIVVVTGTTVPDIKAQLQAKVDAKVDAESDAVLNANIVGKALVTSK